MSVTPSFSLSPKYLARLVAVGALLGNPAAGLPQAVPPAVSSQANIDASAQRRLQENAREAQRRRRIEDQIRNLSPALSSEELAGPGGPVLARKALAAMVRLREEGISPEEAVSRATSYSEIDSGKAAKPSSYLRNLFIQKSGQITPAILAKLEAGEDPAPDLEISPFVP